MPVHICQPKILRHLQTRIMPCRNFCYLLKSGWLLFVCSNTYTKPKNSVVGRLLEDPNPSWKTELKQRAFCSMVYGQFKCFLQSKFTTEVENKPVFFIWNFFKASFVTWQHKQSWKYVFLLWMKVIIKILRYSRVPGYFLSSAEIERQWKK